MPLSDGVDGCPRKYQRSRQELGVLNGPIATYEHLQSHAASLPAGLCRSRVFRIDGLSQQLPHCGLGKVTGSMDNIAASGGLFPPDAEPWKRSAISGSTECALKLHVWAPVSASSERPGAALAAQLLEPLA